MSTEQDTTELLPQSDGVPTVDSPIDPLQTREIENASDSDGSDTTTHEYSPYQSSDEGKHGEGDPEDLFEDDESIKPSTSSDLRSKIDIASTKETGLSRKQEVDEDVAGDDGEGYGASDGEYDGDVDDLAEVIGYEDYGGDDYDDVAEDDDALEEEESVDDQEEESDDANDSDDELIDLDDDEEIKFDENYHPASIPVIIADSTYNSAIPSLTELQAAVREDDEFPFALLDDFQLDLESYMRANLHKQLALMDEISKLLTNNPADFELEQLPDSADVEPPTEIIPIDFKPTAEGRLRCSQKDQTKLYLVELWWVWVETLMPKISEDFLKKFKTVLIDKCKPRHMSEHFVNEPKSGRKLRSPDPLPEVNGYDVKLYELQLIEDNELESDYEPDMNAPIYYKMPAAEHDDTGPEYPEVIVLRNGEEPEIEDTEDEVHGKRRKRSPIELQSPSAKRKRTDSGSKECESPKSQPPPLVLARRRSSQSVRSSASPPVLSPILRTPVKTTETPTKGSEIFLDPNRREPENAKKKERRRDRETERAERKMEKQRRKERRREKSSKALKSVNKIDEEDDELLNRRDEFCDSESVLSISDVEFDLSDDDAESFASDASYSKLRTRLAELQEEAMLTRQFESLGEGDEADQDVGERLHHHAERSTGPSMSAVNITNMEAGAEMPDFDCYSDEFVPPELSVPISVVKETTEDSEPELYDSEGETAPKGQEVDTDYGDDADEINAQLEFNGVILKGEDLAPLVAANIISIESESEVIDWTEGDRVFPTSTANDLDKKFDEEQMDSVSRELLQTQRELAVALFQFRQKSKLMYDYLSEELERQELVNELERAEEKLYDNLECPSEKVNNEDLLESFKVLTNYYSENGLQLESLEEDSPDLVALRNLDISERTF
ncbi:hypothetical protein FO519_003574 [Halicephalobus sp. NKZ332]|nr:hypothetical protein FO519_003574 [Halicephalobus sp. NKZ332]